MRHNQFMFGLFIYKKEAGTDIIYVISLQDYVFEVSFVEKWNFEGTYVVSSYIEKEMWKP